MQKTQRQKSALVWLAILTITAMAAVRVEGVWSSQTPYTQSMLRFLAAHQDPDGLTAGVPGLLERWSGGFLARSANTSAQPTHTEFWLSMLPVVFVGLAASPRLALNRLQLTPDGAQFAPLPVCYK